MNRELKQQQKPQKNNKIGVIGTTGTVNSGIYTEYLRKIKPEALVYSKACPLFCPLVEENWLYDSVTIETAERYLSELKGYGVDTLVLGCTHYPLLRRTLQKVMGDKVQLVNPAYETALELKRVLEKHGINNTEWSKHEHEFYVSDGADKFREFANTILPCDVVETSAVNIEQY